MKISITKLLGRLSILRTVPVIVITLMVAASLGESGLVAIAAPPPSARLAAVGPVDATNGYPTWYQDKAHVMPNGTVLAPLTMGLCLDPNEPLCGFAAPFDFDPAQPISFPGNFPGESFYMLASSGLSTNGGRAVLVLGLEAAFAGGAPVPGDQMVFGRVRVLMDLPDPLPAGAVYKVTHPYGVDTFTPEAGGKRAVFFSEDIGVTPGEFTGALASRIGPFLRWDPAIAPAAPTGYIGDPAVEHRVVGSPYNTNYFRITGPSIGQPGSPFLCNPTPTGMRAVDCIESKNFSLLGKITDLGGVDVGRATYSRDADGSIFVDVFASSRPVSAPRLPYELVVSDPAATPAFEPAVMTTDGSGRYFARAAVPAGAALPAQVSVTNRTDVPASSKLAQVVDAVVISQAAYDIAAGTLTVAATSSYPGATAPTLTVLELGSAATVVSGAPAASFALTVPPAVVTVSSSRGGSATVPVISVGPASAPLPVVANAGPDRLDVVQRTTVRLSGTGSTGIAPLTYRWAQTAGTLVTITGATTASPSFVAPAVSGTLTFKLTVTDGRGAKATDLVAITVVPPAPPVARIIAPESVPQGTVVTLDGSASSGAATYAWTQIAGPVVTLSGATTRTAKFTFPKRNVSLTFRLKVTGPGGTSTATTVVAVEPDIVTVAVAEYRSSTKTWRVDGFATVTANNSVTIRLGTATGTIIGTAPVDPFGAWTLRTSTSPVIPAAGATVTIVSAKGGVASLPVTIRQ